jgi:MFS family permease
MTAVVIDGGSSRATWWRWSAFFLGCAAFFLSFFHRVCTGAIAGDLQREFEIGAAALGTLGATYFYVYGLTQVPMGILIDTIGPRIILSVGMAVAGIGSIAYGLAGSFGAALAARALIGLGVSGMFICTLKLHANWFAEQRFATAVGVSNVSGILGALVATAPLAWLVTQMPWRHVFIIIGVISLVLAAAIALLVRDAPTPQENRVAAGEWRGALCKVAANPATWPPFWLTFSMSGAFMTLVSLWSAPYLVHKHGMSLVEAGVYPAIVLVAFAISVSLLGWWSDRVRARRPITLACSIAFFASGVLWLVAPTGSSAWFVVAAVLSGLTGPGFTLAWSVAKEVNPPASAGMAIAIVNIGGFAASGILQPLVGWVVDHGAGTVAGGSGDAYWLGIAVIVGWTLMGIVAATRLTETRCRNVWSESGVARG